MVRGQSGVGSVPQGLQIEQLNCVFFCFFNQFYLDSHDSVDVATAFFTSYYPLLDVYAALPLCVLNRWRDWERVWRPSCRPGPLYLPLCPCSAVMLSGAKACSSTEPCQPSMGSGITQSAAGQSSLSLSEGGNIRRLIERPFCKGD